MIYDVRPNLVIGFHGCDKVIRDTLVGTPNDLRISEKPYDWLGHGFYFWENNFERAFQWACDKKRQGKIKEPAVVGAVINLGYCCDFLDSKGIGVLKSYYNAMVEEYAQLGQSLPENRNIAGDPHQDKLLRELDCAVIEYMHAEIYNLHQADNVRMFDSVRGMFTEGGPAFNGSGIMDKSHIQICIRNLDSIKGFFIPRTADDFVAWNRNKYGETYSKRSWLN